MLSTKEYKLLEKIHMRAVFKPDSTAYSQPSAGLYKLAKYSTPWQNKNRHAYQQVNKLAQFFSSPSRSVDACLAREQHQPALTWEA